MRCARLTLASTLALCAIVGMSACKKIGAGEAAAQRSIEIDGSSNVGPISEAVATEFLKGHPGTQVTVKISGSGGGFKRFTVGETDISDASRPIQKDELDRAREHNVEFIELPVACDGITLAVRNDNTWTDSLTIDEIHKIFMKDSPVTTWKDVRPNWPDTPISLWTPGVASGTFDFFNEVVFPDKGEMRIADLNMSVDPHVIVRGIESDAGALGFFGFSYFASNKDRLRAVPIDPGDGKPVMPSHDSISDGSYHPFGRPLYIYVNKDSASRQYVQEFIDFYLENVPRLCEAVGYVRLRPEMYDLTKQIFAERKTGTLWIDSDGEPRIATIAEVYGF